MAALVRLVAPANGRVVSWRALLTVLILVILFIPIRRYILPGHLPFRLEPYRLLVALLVLIWLGCLLIDPRTKLKRTGIEVPLLLFIGAALCSIVANGARISAGRLDANVLKTLTFAAGFILVLYIVVGVVKSGTDISFLLKLLVVGGGVISVFAVIESRTGFNVFNRLDRVAPFLKRDYSVDLPPRNGRLRAYGPAEHAIALSAMLAMLVPVAGYLAYTLRRRRWWLLVGLIFLGCLSTVSRTGVLMLVVEALVFAMLRPSYARRLWPALIPLLIAVHFALPGTLGTIKSSFFPQGGLTQDQQGFQGTGRFGKARLDPTFQQIDAQPIFGIGFGTRIVTGPDKNALILDDQWLANVLETGIVGAFAWVWILVRTIRRLARSARNDLSDRGWLVTAIAASITGYAVSMITYDAFSFIQVTFIFYILLGLAEVVVPTRAVEAVRVPAGGQQRRGLAFAGTALILWAVAVTAFVLVQGPSVKFLLFVLALLAAGSWAAEAARGRGRAEIRV